MRVRALARVLVCRVLRRNRHNRGAQFGVRRERSMKAYEMQARARHQGGKPLHEFERRHYDVARTIAIGCFQLEHHLPGAVDTQALIGEGRARDVAAQLLKVAALIGGAAHPRMQPETVGVGAQLLGNRRRASRRFAQAQRLAPPARPVRDTVGAGGGLQRREQVLRIDDPVRIRHIGHALFFDQLPLAGQQPQDAGDDLSPRCG